MPPNRLEPEEQTEGDREGTSDFMFARIGSSVPLYSENSQFDLNKLPGRPLAVSEEHGALFLVSHGGFMVVKTTDVIGLAKGVKEIEEGSRGKEEITSLCVHEKSIVDVKIGDVHILSLSSDSTTLAAVVGRALRFYSVSSLLQKKQEVASVYSTEGSGIIKDFAWRKDGKASFFALTDCGKLCSGEMKDDLKVIMEGVEAADWKMNGSSLAVAKKSALSILSSGLEEKLSTPLLFDSWIGDSDSNITVKVDSVRWVRNDSIVIGCVQVSDDNEEIDYMVQVISTNPPGFDEASSSATVIYFSDLFHGIVDDMIPYGSGPHLFMNYLENWDLAFVANRKNTDDHIVLLAWSGDGVKVPICLELEQDKFLPRIELQENRDENLLVGMDIDRVSIYEKLAFVFNLEEKVLSPRCILLCLSCEGKLILFHVARLSEPAVSMPESVSRADNNSSAILTSGEAAPSKIFLGAEQNTPSDGKRNMRISREPVLSIDPESQAFGVLSPTLAPDKPSFSTIVKEKIDLIPESPAESLAKFGVGSTLDLSVNSYSALTLQGDRTEASSTFGRTQVHSESKEVSQTLFPSDSLPDVTRRFQSVAKAGVSESIVSKSSVFNAAVSPHGKSKEAFESQRKTAAGFSSAVPQSVQRPPEPAFVSSFDRTKELLRADVGIHSAKESSIPGKFTISKSQEGIGNRAYNVPGSKESATKAQKQLYSGDGMAEEIDDLLQDIEREGGFRDACTVSHSSSVMFLEEGIGRLSAKLRKCKAKVEEQLKDIQELQDQRMQVTARQVYIEELVKQASNGQYWDLWNNQKLGPEFEVKQQRISKLNHALVSELIELERHFNTLELQNHRDCGGFSKGRRASRETSISLRPKFSVHSLYNTVNLQLSAAEKLSDSLSKHMGQLKIGSPPSKQHSVKKELFKSIGLDYDSDSFQSPQQTKIVSDLSSTIVGPKKSMEPESTRRRRDSLDKSWTKFDPPKTTVKRTPPEGRKKTAMGDSFQIAAGRFQARVEEITPAYQKKTSSLFVEPKPSSSSKWRMELPQESPDIPSSLPSQEQLINQVSSTKSSQSSQSDRAASSESLSLPAEKTLPFVSSISQPKTMTNKFPSFASASAFGRSSTIASSSSSPSQISFFSSTSVNVSATQTPESIPKPQKSTSISNEKATPTEIIPKIAKSTPSETIPKPQPTASLFSAAQSEKSTPKTKSWTLTVPAISNEKSTPAEIIPKTTKSTPSQTIPKPQPTVSLFPAAQNEESRPKPLPLAEKSTSSEIIPKSTTAEFIPKPQPTAAPLPAVQTLESTPKPQPSTFTSPAVSLLESTAVETVQKPLPTATLVPPVQTMESTPKPEPSTFTSAVISPPESMPLTQKSIPTQNIAVTEDEMEEETSEVNTMLSFNGFGLGQQPPAANRPNPFGVLPGGQAFSLAPPTGELFRPPSFSLPVNQSVQPSQPAPTGGFGGGLSGFGQPAQIGPAQQALGSVLGSFGQSRQLGFGAHTAGVAPTTAGFPATEGGGGFAAAAGGGGGFAAAAGGGGGFAAAAGGGGGFAAAAGGGGGFAAAAGGGGGFAAMSSRPSGFAAVASSGGGSGGPPVSGGFGAFSSSPVRPTQPSFLTQMRK